MSTNAARRNQPCPCGSGRKYKGCCGAGAVAALPAYSRAESSRAVDLVMQMIHSPMFAAARAAAQYEFFHDAFASITDEQIQAALSDEQTGIAFNAWLMFDAYITKDRHRLTDSLLSEGVRTQFSSGQIRFLEFMAASHMRPYEIRDVRRDEGFRLRDLWNDAEIMVTERAATHSLASGDTLFARVNPGPSGQLEFNGALLPLMPVAMHDLLQRLRASFRAKSRKRPELDEATFFKEAGPRIARAWIERLTWKPRLTTSDGDELRLQTLIFDVAKPEALIDALRRSDAFDATEAEDEFLWLGAGSNRLGLETTIMGTLILSGSRLEAQVMSDERAERLRALLERAAPGAVRFRLSRLEDISRAQGSPVTVDDDDARLPPELEAQVLQNYADRYYRAWLDEEIPVLAGRTPRKAAGLKTQRAKVAALLREITRTPPGSVPVDLDWMWDDLGLSDLR